MSRKKRKKSKRRANRSSIDAAAASDQRRDPMPSGETAKSGERPSQGPLERTSPHGRADPPDGPRASSEDVNRPSAGQPKAAVKWKKAVAGALSLPTVTGGLISGLPPAAVTALQQSSQPAAASSGQNLSYPPPPVRPPSAGGEYLLSAEWKNFVGPDNINLGAAEQLALSVVKLANHFAGDRKLTPGFTYSLIQQVLIEVDGITPAKAADLLQKQSSTASPLLDSLINMIRRWT